jgi:putative Mg2+ transporter-C (MgtC) family protein
MEWLGPMPDLQQMLRVGSRLLAAMLAGAVIGMQREQARKPAGLRTHVLVAVGTALYVIASVEYGMNDDALSRVIQGVVTGIGFLGAGTILKLRDEQEIRGLTTAASVWMTAALGIVIGLGQFALALLATLLAWIVLSTFARMEGRIERSNDDGGGDGAK